MYNYDDIKKAERFILMMKILAVAIPLITMLIIFNILLNEVLHAIKAEIMGNAKFEILFETYLVGTSNGPIEVTHVKMVYLTEPTRVRVDDKILLLSPGTPLEFGLRYLSLLPFLIPLTITCFIASLKFYRISVDRRRLKNLLKRPHELDGRLEKILLASILVGFWILLIEYSSAYWPLTCLYPVVDVDKEVYISPSFKKLLSPGYVMSSYTVFVCILIIAISVGIFFYSLAKGTENYIRSY